MAQTDEVPLDVDCTWDLRREWGGGIYYYLLMFESRKDSQQQLESKSSASVKVERGRDGSGSREGA
eukprot:3400486-Rhodomonas_salina.3